MSCYLSACLKITYFAQFLCWLKNLILEIRNVFLRLNFSTALNFDKLSHFQTGLSACLKKTGILGLKARMKNRYHLVNFNWFELFLTQLLGN